MKSQTYFSIRSRGVSPRTTYRSEQEAFESAKVLCLTSGNEMSIVMHDGDITRLVRKVSLKR